MVPPRVLKVIEDELTVNYFKLIDSDAKKTSKAFGYLGKSPSAKIRAWCLLDLSLPSVTLPYETQSLPRVPRIRKMKVVLWTMVP